MTDARRRRARRMGAFLLVLAAEFGIFEVALRTWGHSEAAPAFQGLFTPDEVTGYRLQPGARVRFTTSEFDTDIAINSRGVRDDEEIGPKAPNERRIVILGDSLVLSVQVPFGETFGELLEHRLNAEQSHVPVPRDQRRRAGLRPRGGTPVLPHRRQGVRAGPRHRDVVRRQRCGGSGLVRRAADRRCPAARTESPGRRDDLGPPARAPQHGAPDSAAPRGCGNRSVQPAARSARAASPELRRPPGAAYRARSRHHAALHRGHQRRG